MAWYKQSSCRSKTQSIHSEPNKYSVFVSQRLRGVISHYENFDDANVAIFP